ncbi:magnesium and cobalt transport protein CorA [Putridiphycobacter roseus]|uniref:Magnesium and cobalt transport protein CorA n=1 Tax=Putridiphycobacter roseus TaxID=2219161 RepID=A0A2W1N0P1_9FLAO|nr:magnesium and cobalt transport protein CorA [Putridiphycobacter roseus]PZE17817.1 magnesium and cobalt transport protein CorA [Putridiphycobacter roseus]
MSKSPKKNKANKSDNVLQTTSSYTYSIESYSKNEYKKVEDIVFDYKSTSVQWLNIYGLNFDNDFKKIIIQNGLDEFLINLLSDDDHRNKVIELDNCLFMSIKAIHYKNEEFLSEQMMFVCGPNFLWSIQEIKGDYFGHIRERISDNKGVVRKKNADYLLYLVIEAIIDNYFETYEVLFEKIQHLKDLSNVKPSPEFAVKLENNKQDLFILKKAISSLRDAINRFDKIQLENFETNYFSELKEQANFMIDDIDFDLQQLESSINLMFNIQSHRLNEVMKTLTVLSVIFIPLTFMAGIYGMNFKNMPELNTANGYYILLGIMAVMVISIIFYFKKKGWFD